jgi:hypothetical protein
MAAPFAVRRGVYEGYGGPAGPGGFQASSEARMGQGDNDRRVARPGILPAGCACLRIDVYDDSRLSGAICRGGKVQSQRGLTRTALLADD